jgi:hypothetical protein
MDEVVSRETYEMVLRIAALPALLFVIWLSWIITNRLMSPEWQQKRRSKQIKKAVAERAALMAELRAADAAKASDQKKPVV